MALSRRLPPRLRRWRMQPPTPPWKPGIHRAQRYLHLAALLPRWQGDSRALPLRFVPAFPPKAVAGAAEPRSEATAAQAELAHLRAALDAAGRAEQRVLALGDGSYEGATLWATLPARSVLLVRSARHRVLHDLPPAPPWARSAAALRAARPHAPGVAARRRGLDAHDDHGARALDPAALPGGGPLSATRGTGAAALPAGGQGQRPRPRQASSPARAGLLPGQRASRGRALGAALARGRVVGLGLAAVGSGGHAPRDEDRLGRGRRAMLAADGHGARGAGAGVDLCLTGAGRLPRLGLRPPSAHSAPCWAVVARRGPLESGHPVARLSPCLGQSARFFSRLAGNAGHLGRKRDLAARPRRRSRCLSATTAPRVVPLLLRKSQSPGGGRRYGALPLDFGLVEGGERRHVRPGNSD